MMALLLLLVATVVSIVIVTVALTSTMHVTDNKTSQQEYLACVSAAEMLRDGLAGSTYTYKDQTWTYTYTERQYSWTGTKDVTKTETLNEYPEETDSRILKDFVTELSKVIRQDTSKNSATAMITKDFTITQSDEDIYDVKASCGLWYVDKDSYVLKVNFETTASNESTGYRMSMSIPIKCKISGPVTTENQTHKCSTSSTSRRHYNYNDEDRRNGQHSTFTVNTITTTVTWDQGKISKGWS